MRKILLFSLVAGLILLFSGCNHQTDTLLERAESYLPAHPDSAEVCLDSIPQEELSDDQRAMYGLLRTVISNHKGDGVTSDSLIRPSYEYYRKVTDAGMTADLDLLRRYAQSCYYMCVFYTNSDSIDRCGELGVEIYGIGIGENTAVGDLFRESEKVSDAAELPEAMKRLMKRTFFRKFDIMAHTTLAKIMAAKMSHI